MAYVREVWRSLALSAVGDKALEELLEAWNRELSPLLRAMRAEVNRLGGDVVTVSADHNLLLTESTVLLDPSGGGFTVYLPSAEAAKHKTYRFLKNVSGDQVLIYPKVGETINGAPQFFGFTSIYNTLDIFSTGEEWIRVGMET